MRKIGGVQERTLRWSATAVVSERQIRVGERRPQWRAGTDSTTQIAADYRVLGIPTHIFVDREGIIRDMRVGGMSKKTMEKEIALIARPSAP